MVKKGAFGGPLVGVKSTPMLRRGEGPQGCQTAGIRTFGDGMAKKVVKNEVPSSEVRLSVREPKK